MSSVVNFDFDDILREIAKTLYNPLDIDDLGKALGFGPADTGRTITDNTEQGGNYMGTLDLLRTWRKRQTPSTEKAALREALLKVPFARLADLYLSISVTGESSKLTEGTTENCSKHEEDLLRSTQDWNDILLVVAKRLWQNSEIDTLGRKLGFSPEDIQGYIATNHKTQNLTWDGTLQMLRDWRDRQPIPTWRDDLKTALEESGQINLADYLFSFQ